MTYPTIIAQRDATQVAFDKITTDLTALTDKALEAWKDHQWLKQQADATKTIEMGTKSANARRIAKQTEGQIEQANREADKLHREVKRLDMLLNADDELIAARANWEAASTAQVNRTREAQDARAHLAELEAALRVEMDVLLAAQASQRAAALAELGFGDKPDGTTAAASTKAVQQAQIKAEALREAMQAAQGRIAAADLALLAADKPTRDAEAAILTAKLHQAQRDHAEAYAVHLEALHRLHGAETAVGVFGPRIVIYNDMTTVEQAKFAAIAADLKAAAERGE